FRVFDGLAVHVADIEGAVRTCLEKHGPKPIIATAQDLGCSGAAPRREGSPDGYQLVAVHEVAGRIAGERIPSETFPEGISPVNVNATSGAERSRVRIRRGEIGANRIDPSGRSPSAHERILNQLRAILQHAR